MRKSRIAEISGGIMCMIAAISLVIISGKHDPYKP